MKKMLAVLMTIVLMLTAFPAMADNERVSGLFTYTLKGNGTAVITKFDWEKNSNKDVFIPSMLDGYTVTGIGDNAFEMGDYRHLRWHVEPVNITLPETIVSIGEKAFFNVQALSINIPNSVQLIMPGAMATYDYSVRYIVSPDHPVFATIKGSLYNKTKKELIAYTSEDINSSEQKVVVPSGINSIGAYAFYSDGSGWKISSIELPESVKTIGDYAFAGTSGYFSMPGVKQLGVGAFSGCYLYGGSMFSSDELTVIADYAFENCTFKFDWTIPDSVKYIGNSAFKGARFEKNRELKLPSQLEHIGHSAFASAYLILWKEEIVFPDSVEYIGAYAFQDVEDLTKVTLPNSDCEILYGAFIDNDKLTSVTIPSNITSIDTHAFERGTLTLKVTAGSYGEFFAKENGFTYEIEGQEDDLSWLNN